MNVEALGVLALRQMDRRGWTPYLIRKLLGDQPTPGTWFQMKGVFMLETAPGIRRWFGHRKWRLERAS